MPAGPLQQYEAAALTTRTRRQQKWQSRLEFLFVIVFFLPIFGTFELCRLLVSFAPMYAAYATQTGGFVPI